MVEYSDGHDTFIRECFTNLLLNPETYCGRGVGLTGHRRMFAIKESNKSRFDSYGVRNSVLIISHITFSGLKRVHMFSDNLSRNSCIHGNIKVQPAGTCHVHVATVRKRLKR